MSTIDLEVLNLYTITIMILNYSVKNFYSIGEDGATVNFAVNGNAPKTDLYVNTGEAGGRVSLIETVIGPNASGKTQLLKGLAFLRHMITASYQDHPEASLLFEPHLGLSDAPSELSVRFTVDTRVFEYFIQLTTEKILKEELKEFSKTKERFTDKVIAVRTWDDTKSKYIFTDKVLDLTDAGVLRRNASMIASAMQKDAPSELAELISDYWTDCVLAHNLWVHGNRDDVDTGDKLLRFKLRQIFRKDNSLLRDRVKEILLRFDIGFDDFVEEVLESLDGQRDTKYYLNHSFTDSNFVVPIENESSGTKRLVSILTSIVQVLAVDCGGIAVVDEIDAYLHPDIVEALVDLFVYPETNPNHAQLLFSTHNHRLLESFDKQQITLTEKNEFGNTEAWRLDEVEDVDSRDNYYTKYITGAYGARPKLGG